MQKQKYKVKSPTIVELRKILDKMILQKRSYTYVELARMVYGEIEDQYRLFFCVARLQYYFRYLRKKYKLHLYSVDGKVLLLRTAKHFNTVIASHERKIKDYRRVINILTDDRNNRNYEKDVRERFDEWKENTGG